MKYLLTIAFVLSCFVSSAQDDVRAAKAKAYFDSLYADKPAQPIPIDSATIRRKFDGSRFVVVDKVKIRVSPSPNARWIAEAGYGMCLSFAYARKDGWTCVMSSHPQLGSFKGWVKTNQLTKDPFKIRDTSWEILQYYCSGVYTSVWPNNSNRVTVVTGDVSYSYDNSRQYIRGARGGCYYINGSGKKVYVDRSLCN